MGISFHVFTHVFETPKHTHTQGDNQLDEYWPTMIVDYLYVSRETVLLNSVANQKRKRAVS